MEFNPDFVARMIPKVEWAALLEAADTVRTLPQARAHPGGGGGLTAGPCPRPGNLSSEQGVGCPELT